MDTSKPQNEILIYTGDGGQPIIDVRTNSETIWLTQAQLVALFDSSKANISEHIKNIFSEGELTEGAVVRKFRTTAADSKTYTVLHYNLDMIISLGYRVRSQVATHFRQWATARLREFIIKGFAIDDFVSKAPCLDSSRYTKPRALYRATLPEAHARGITCINTMHPFLIKRNVTVPMRCEEGLNL